MLGNDLLRKGLVLALVVLFVGAGVVPLLESRNSLKSNLKTVTVCDIMDKELYVVDRDRDSTIRKPVGEERNGDIGLDYDFMWNVTTDLSNVIHNTSVYPPGSIRKGRAFGTQGEHWTANHIRNKSIKLNLENVKKIPLGPIKCKKWWDYTSKVETVDFNLTVNHPDWNFTDDGHVPKNETFVFPSGRVNRYRWPLSQWMKMSYNHTFNDIRVLPKNFSENWFITEAGSNDYLNVSNIAVLNVFSYICGNATYLHINESLPEDQEGRVFLFDEEEGCEGQLDNVTNAIGIILIHNNTGSRYHADYNFSNLTVQSARVNNNDDNLSTVLDMLENGSIMVVDNLLDNQTFTFVHNFSYLCSWWPSYDFFIVGGLKGLENLHGRAFQIWFLNPILQNCGRGWCHGFITYVKDMYDVHNMDMTSRYWIGWANTPFEQFNWSIILTGPSIQVFSVNRSVGEFLKNSSDGPNNPVNVTGYFKQKYTKEDHTDLDPDKWTAGIEAYNVEGNISIDQSPQDKIAIIEGRMDGWWGETPGDSGASVGMVLGIAKYFKDYNIEPKYNLTFLVTTGEEYGFRGAWHYHHSHPENDYKIIRWIGLDQLGFIPTNISETNLTAHCKNKTEKSIIWAIANASNYKNDSGYNFKPEKAELGTGHTNDVAWLTRDSCDTIVIYKTNDWRHHLAGMNYVEGDSMKYMDRDDLNATFNFTWDVVKYFTVNPDCWFENDTFTPVDTDDEDNLNDSINVTFTIKTVMPHDLVMVNATLKKGGNIIDEKLVNYTVNTTGVQDTITLTLPEDGEEGWYTCRLYLYNSTGRINEIVELDVPGKKYNDTIPYPFVLYYLYPYGAGNDCLDLISVSMAKNKQSINPLFLQFLERLIDRFPLLEQILSLLPVFNRISNLQ